MNQQQRKSQLSRLIGFGLSVTGTIMFLGASMVNPIPLSVLGLGLMILGIVIYPRK